jgi:hypothetical protein
MIDWMLIYFVFAGDSSQSVVILVWDPPTRLVVGLLPI